MNGYSEKNCLANDVHGVPAITGLLLRIRVGGQGKHSYTLTVFGVKHSATLSIMIPMIASMSRYIGASTATEGRVGSGEMIT